MAGLQFVLMKILDIICVFCFVGTSGMSSKAKKEARRKEAVECISVGKTRKEIGVRRGVTSRTVSSETKCSMHLQLYLLNCNEWFLHKSHQYCYHPWILNIVPR